MKKFKIGIFSKKSTLEFLYDEHKEIAIMMACEHAAEELGIEADTIRTNAEIFFITDENAWDEADYDFSIKLSGDPNECPYSMMLLDETYDGMMVNITRNGSNHVEMPFFIFKEMLRKVCCFTAAVASTVGMSVCARDTYIDALDDFLGTSTEEPEEDDDDIYDNLADHMIDWTDEVAEVFSAAFAILMSMFANISTLPAGMQKSLIGRTITLDKTQPEQKTKKMLDALALIDDIEEGNEYDYVMENLISVFADSHENTRLN